MPISARPSSRKTPSNNKMQRTRPGQNRGSPLILVFCGPQERVVR
jgi:hypothetical protein